MSQVLPLALEDLPLTPGNFTMKSQLDSQGWASVGLGGA
jgi:hypothetical protein